jgi:hypothetical protein
MQQNPFIKPRLSDYFSSWLFKRLFFEGSAVLNIFGPIFSALQMTRASSLPNITDSGDSGFAQQSPFDSTSVDNKYNESIQLLNQNIKRKHFRRM